MFIQSKASTGSSNSLIIQAFGFKYYIYQLYPPVYWHWSSTGTLLFRWFTNFPDDGSTICVDGNCCVLLYYSGDRCRQWCFRWGLQTSPQVTVGQLFYKRPSCLRPRRNSLYLHWFIPSWDQRCRYCRSTLGHNCFPWIGVVRRISSVGRTKHWYRNNVFQTGMFFSWFCSLSPFIL